ncbi:MAG: sugar transferase [Anaerolineae bacterium]|nr:MAG: sugar transferase [Anaerolineae bacterium]
MYHYAQYAWITRFNPEKRIFVGKSYHFMKRVMDLSLTILTMPFWLPLLLLIALAIKISAPKDPVLFTQMRTGKGGRRFKMLKFRTMVPNAEQLKSQLAQVNANGELTGPLKLKNDPRVTKIGRFLRKTSMDELPQLINVLKGEMSLVGPRPTSWSANTYKLWQTERLDVMPGIVGLWQVYGRGSENFDEWLRMDIAYIERRSIWLDFCLLVMAVFVVFRQKGAR